MLAAIDATSGAGPVTVKICVAMLPGISWVVVRAGLVKVIVVVEGVGSGATNVWSSPATVME